MRRWARPRLAAVLAAVAVLAGATGAWAGSQTFSDVPPEHPFFNEIGAVASAGITTGFNDGTFRPGQNVTRGAMAAFMGRGFGRVAGADLTGNISAAGGFTSVGSTPITAGATGSGGGFVQLTAMVNFSVAAVEQCPCRLSARLTQVGSGPNIPARVDVPFFGLPLTLTENVFLTARYPIAADATETYAVEVDVIDSVAGATVTGTLVAVYVPFDGEGNIG